MCSFFILWHFRYVWIVAPSPAIYLFLPDAPALFPLSFFPFVTTLRTFIPTLVYVFLFSILLLVSSHLSHYVFVHSVERCLHHLFRYELVYLTMLHFRVSYCEFSVGHWPAARLIYVVLKCVCFITYKVLVSRFPVFVIKKNISTLGSETGTAVA
jgi:hypothetical protein